MICSSKHKSEIIVTLDDILETTYKRKAEVERYLTYVAYREDPTKSNKELSELYGVCRTTIRLWRPEYKNQTPFSVGFVDWAKDNYLLEEIDCDYSKTNLGITPSTPRFPLLEKLTYYTWTTGLLSDKYDLRLCGSKEGLIEICEDINLQLNTDFEITKQENPIYISDAAGHILILKSNLGRLVAPLLGFCGNKLENLQSIPAIAKKTYASRRLFLQILNETRGLVAKSRKPRYQIHLPSVKNDGIANRLVNDMLSLIKDVTDLELYSCINTGKEGQYRPTIYTHADKTIEYLEACMLKL